MLAVIVKTMQSGCVFIGSGKEDHTPLHDYNSFNAGSKINVSMPRTDIDYFGVALWPGRSVSICEILESGPAVPRHAFGLLDLYSLKPRVRFHKRANRLPGIQPIVMKTLTGSNLGTRRNARGKELRTTLWVNAAGMVQARTIVEGETEEATFVILGKTAELFLGICIHDGVNASILFVPADNVPTLLNLQPSELHMLVLMVTPGTACSQEQGPMESHKKAPGTRGQLNFGDGCCTASRRMNDRVAAAIKLLFLLIRLFSCTRLYEKHCFGFDLWFRLQ
ncbi:hypothetical protein RJ641_008203 [Dillenia turbinata]|uniref:Uncharacterized protein n=1 Tax=Dillenia turbinata TaxID=194707 RepID=A0AAN8V4H3_9MAGN